MVVADVFGFGVSTGAGVAGVAAAIPVFGGAGVVLAPPNENPPCPVGAGGGALLSAELEAAPPNENPPAAEAGTFEVSVAAALGALSPPVGAVEALSLEALGAAALNEKPPPAAAVEDFESAVDEAAGVFFSVPGAGGAVPNDGNPLAGGSLAVASEFVDPPKENPPVGAESFVEAAGALLLVLPKEKEVAAGAAEPLPDPKAGAAPDDSFLLSPCVCVVEPPKENVAGAFVSPAPAEGAGAVAPKVGAGAPAEKIPPPEAAGAEALLAFVVSPLAAPKANPAPLAGAVLVVAFVPPNENAPVEPLSLLFDAPAGAGVFPKEKPPAPEVLLLLPKEKLMVVEI